MLILLYAVQPDIFAQEKNNNIFYSTTTPPVFPGGDEALKEFIGERLVYPYSARKDSIQGRVFVRFRIDSIGYVRDAYVAKGIHPDCDSAALKIVRQMPRWIPSKSEPNMIFTLPIIFKLPDDKVMSVCEIMPEFEGGTEAMFKFINCNLRYPTIGDSDVQGRVMIKFVITKEGKLVDPIILRSIGYHFDQEALRVVKLMDGKWTAASHRGKSVDCYYIIPVAFRLLH